MYKRKPWLLFGLWFSTTLLFLACLDEEPTARMHPPNWIHGTWQDAGQNVEFIFIYGNVTQKGKGKVTKYHALPQSTIEELVVSNTEYKFSLSGSVTQIYKFEKDTATKIRYSLTNDGADIGQPVALLKQ